MNNSTNQKKEAEENAFKKGEKDGQRYIIKTLLKT